MSYGAPQGDLTLLMGTAVLVAFLSATQDVAVDALRVESLEPARQGAGAAAGVLGYRVALLLTGALGFRLADQVSWPTTYLIMGGIQAIGLVAAMVAREPAATAVPATWTAAVVDPLRDYLGRRGWPLLVVVLGFAVFYKLGDALAGTLVTPFLLTHGYTQTDLGNIQGTLGLVATLVGVVAGGAALLRWGMLPCLLAFGILQALSNGGYAILALQPGGDLTALGLVITVENLCGGLGTACFVAFLSSECSPAFAATQYALLSSLSALGRDALASTGGQVKVWAGLEWAPYFVLTAAAAVPGLLMLWPMAWLQARRGTQQTASSAVESP